MSKLSTFLAEQILLEESTPIKKTIVVYVGRFQPFHKGHYTTYLNLVKKFGKDNVYIGTSNKIEKPKSPFNFKEKKQIMTTMFGIPSNKIVEVKNPYAPTEILKNFDENTTAFVTVVGEKDSNRLGGKYFAKWDGHPTEGYKDRGYVYVSPAQPNAISGTDVRVGLGNGSEEQKQNYFVDRAYPKFNKQIFKLISDKLNEAITLDVEIGDTILMGKFKNKKVVVKSIGKDEHGMPTINGKKVATFRMIEEGTEVIFEASNEDEKYTHIGYGRYKLKGKEDDKTSPTFTKDDSGKYIQSQSQTNEPKSDTPQGTAVKGAKMFAHDPNVKQPTNTQTTDKDWTDGKDGWEILDDPRSKVKNVRKYTDEELQGETSEYFDNEITKKVAPNAFKDESDMIQKIKDAKPMYLSSEQMQNMNNTDIGDILSASEKGGKSAMLKLGKERATKYGKDWDRLERGIAKGNAVPSPIVLKDKTGQLHLLAGNTRLMSFTASGKKLPVKVIDYDGEFQYENADSKKTDTTKYDIKNLKRKISGWAEKEREFFTKNQQRPNSEVRRTIGEMISDKTKGAIQSIKHLAQHEIKEFKEAGIGASKFFKGETLSDEEKGALKSVAFKVATTALFGVVTGGLSHGALAFGKHVAVEFLPHVIGETLLKGVGKAALFAGVDETNEELYLQKFGELIAKNMQEMKIPSDILQKSIMTYKSEIETPQKSVKEQYLSDFKDMVDGMIAEELESHQNEMSKSQLNQVEKYAEKQLSPEDIEFTNHFFDRVNDPRNGKEISDAELTGFFKRLARHKKEFKEFLDKFHQIVVKDKRNDINIPFVKQSNHIIAKTVMRKDDFKSSNQTLTIEDRIPGGKSEGMNIYDIANYHNCDIDELSNQLQIGIKVELEHTSDKKVAEEIAMDHLYEDPKYYTKLATIEADETISEISAMGGSFQNDGNATTGYSWNADWSDYDDQNYYLDNLEGWTTYSDIPSEYEKKKSTDQQLPIDNHEDGKTSKYNRILKYGFKEPAKFSDKSISETIIGNNIVCDNCGWSWKISEGGDDLYICHKCGHDNNPNVNEAFTKGQLFAGNLKIGGVVVPIEVELVGADNKKNAFVTKVINIDKKYLSKLPSNGILEIPARIFRFAGGWRKIKTPSVFESILTEGGAYGHMNHPFDTDINLTFGQLKDIVNRALDGDLELAREKTDGQALAISWVGGRLVAARNKGHLKNRGAGALDIKGVADKFTGRGELEKAYNFAMQDLSKAIKALSEKQREKIFKNGACFMNIEVIYPTSVNVIPYGQPLLVFHGTMEYDMEGNAIGEDSQSGKILGGMIKQVEQNVQANYTLQGPPVLSLPKSQNLSSKKGEYNAKISKLQREFGLGDTAGVAEYHQAWWENFVDKKSPSKLDNNTKMGLVKRWAFGDKGFRVDAKNITDPKVLDWATKIDKEDQGKITKENLMKFEDIFLGVGAEVLSFTSSVLTVNPDKAVRDMKKRLDQTISDVKKSGDPKKIEKLKLELRRLSAVGGVDKIVPIEGIVFVYNGKTFKLTGSFASLNQLLGIFY